MRADSAGQLDRCKLVMVVTVALRNEARPKWQPQLLL